MAQQQEHPIFEHIRHYDLVAVQQHVLADAAVLEALDGDIGMTPLMYAIECQNPAIALWLLKHRGQHDVETADDNRMTALHHASWYGQLEVVQALETAGANLAALDALDSTPLIWASTNGHSDIVDFLLPLPAVKASINHMSRHQWTALSIASSEGHQRIVRRLLDAGADPTIPRWWPLSPLRLALAHTHRHISALLRHTIAEREAADTQEQADEQPILDDTSIEEDDDDLLGSEHPIFDDIRRGDLAAVQQRLRVDAAVLEERGSFWRMTPLMEASRLKQPAIALRLIEHRGEHDLETARCLLGTALHWATKYGQLEIVQALVGAGANPAALSGTSMTPLMWASSSGNADVVAFLLQQPAVKAHIDIIGTSPFNQKRHTALSSASGIGHQDIVQLLLDAGAEPTIPSGPRSPLNQALSQNNNHATAALIRHAIVERARARQEEAAAEAAAVGMQQPAAAAAAAAVAAMDPEEEAMVEGATALPLSVVERPPPLEEYVEAGAPPSGLVCPNSVALFDDPVMLVGDGMTYSRAAIEQHFAFCRERGTPLRSPLTNVQITEPTMAMLVPNFTVRGLVLEYKAAKERAWAEAEQRWRDAGEED